MLKVEGLTKRFGTLTAVNQVSFQVGRGEVFGLLGPNGAGKSTIIKMLTTLLPPDGGRATVAGLDITRQANAVRGVIGYVPQLLSVDGTLTGKENLLLFAELHGLPAGLKRRRIDEALERTGLEAAGERLVRTYSGGMVRRLEIAQAVLHRPDVLFLDEPTVGLDPTARQAVWSYLKELRQELKTTLVITTHYMEEAVMVADRLGMMALGKLGVVGTPEELVAGLPDPTVGLDNLFAYYTGAPGTDEGGRYGDVKRTRETAKRLG